MENEVEHELCGNCKKEIPQHNYVMHTAHCARNITLCPVCKEPVQKNQFEKHREKHKYDPNRLQEKIDFPKQISKTPVLPAPLKETTRNVKASSPMKNHSSSMTKTQSKSVAQYNNNSTSERTSEKVHKQSSFKLNDPPPGARPKTRKDHKEIDKSTTEANYSFVPPPTATKTDSLLPCKYCDLELPKLELEGHENYCGARTDKCNTCGEIVMFKYKKLHEDTNHGFLKLNDEPGPRASWDSNTERQQEPSYYRRQRPEPIYTLDSFDFSPLYNSYSASSVVSDNEKKESYKDISRRLDSGPAPQPPRRRRNPPTELLIPCEFCNTPIPHEDLIQHETGCRPDLARFNPRRRSPSPDDYFTAPEPSSPEVELPCEFCADMIPASQLLRHQLTCN